MKTKDLVVTGTLLVWIGLLWLLSLSTFAFSWPLSLIVAGAWLLWAPHRPDSHPRERQRSSQIQENTLRGDFLYWLGIPLVQLATYLLFTLDIRWHTPLPKGPKIIAPNHPSTTDPFLIALLAQERVHILIDETLFQVPVLGTYLEQTGHVRVVQEQGRSAYIRARELLRTGRTVVIFPEGAISPLAGGFHGPRTGVARLALETGAPVVPVGIHLQRERLRLIETRVQGEIKVGTWYVDGHYAVTGGAPLYLEGDIQDWEQVRSLAQQVMQQVIDLALQGEQRLCTRRPTAAASAAL